MTNGEHNLWLGEALKAVPELKEIDKQLRIANAIEILKELYKLGSVGEVSYIDDLKVLLDKAGFKL